jgi:hypothetical protein
MENRVDDIPHVTDEENDILTTIFTEEKIKEAILQMEHNKAPGPDGFPAEFYQVFWQVIKVDLMAMFYDFYKGELPLYSLNFGIITLLPKCEEAIRIQQYRPMSFKCGFKIFTKVATNRVNRVAQKVIQPTQTAFLPG